MAPIGRASQSGTYHHNLYPWPPWAVSSGREGQIPSAWHVCVSSLPHKAWSRVLHVGLQQAVWSQVLDQGRIPHRERPRAKQKILRKRWPGDLGLKEFRKEVLGSYGRNQSSSLLYTYFYLISFLSIFFPFFFSCHKMPFLLYDNDLIAIYNV